MRAAKLIAERGIGNVSSSDIVAAAEQKNQCPAVSFQRSGRSNRRSIGNPFGGNPYPTRRAHRRIAGQQPGKPAGICMLMVYPAFSLAQESSEYHDYVRAFGHQLVLSEASLLPIVNVAAAAVPATKDRRTAQDSITPSNTSTSNAWRRQ